MSASTNFSLGNRLGVLLITGVLVAGMAIAPAGVAADSAGDDQLVLDVHANGSADMTLTLVYDLTDEQAADGFDSIAEDEEAQEELRDRFEERTTAVTEDTSERVDRDVSVSDATITVERDEDDEIGLVELEIHWTGLVAAEDDQLRLTEPFSSGLDIDADVVVIVPDGYDIAEVEPEPTTAEDDRLTWVSDVDLSGFELVIGDAEEAVAADDDAETPADDAAEDDGVPGLGVFAALGGLLGYAVLRMHGRNIGPQKRENEP